MKVKIYTALYSFEINLVQSSNFNLCENGWHDAWQSYDSENVRCIIVCHFNPEKKNNPEIPVMWLKSRFFSSAGSSLLLESISQEYPNNEIYWLSTLWSGVYGLNMFKKLMFHLFYWILVSEYKRTAWLPSQKEAEDAFPQYNLWSHIQSTHEIKSFHSVNWYFPLGI